MDDRYDVRALYQRHTAGARLRRTFRLRCLLPFACAAVA